MVNYQHRVNNRARNLRITIAKGGEVVVTTPLGTPKFIVDRFVEQNLAWITTHQQKMARRMQAHHDRVELFGKSYTIRETVDPDKAMGITLVGGELLINHLTQPNTKPDQLSSTGQKQLERFLKNTAEKYLLPRTRQWAAKMHTSFGRITLREQKSRWGSCSSQGNLNFNWRLVHHPPAVIDYVIIHELAHRSQMNHSAAFWQIVQTYDPAYPQHRGWLKRRGYDLS